MSTCQADKSWSTPTVFPPGELSVPPKLTKPDEPDMLCQTACMPLKLTYNPNEEQGAGFYCNTPLDWKNLPVKVEPSNTCHLLCDRMLVASVTCREGVWTGKPGLGFWCHQEKERVGHWVDNNGQENRSGQDYNVGQDTNNGQYAQDAQDLQDTQVPQEGQDAQDGLDGEDVENGNQDILQEDQFVDSTSNTMKISEDDEDQDAMVGEEDQNANNDQDGKKNPKWSPSWKEKKQLK